MSRTKDSDNKTEDISRHTEDISRALFYTSNPRFSFTNGLLQISVLFLDTLVDFLVSPYGFWRSFDGFLDGSIVFFGTAVDKMASIDRKKKFKDAANTSAQYNEKKPKKMPQFLEAFSQS